MKKALTLIFVLSLLLLSLPGFNQGDNSRQEKEEKIKEGINFGLLPVIGYNSDIGFQYGLVFNIFNYGKGQYYPDYKYSIYTELSRTTKGGGINQVFFDSKYLLPKNIRITADLSYLTELTLNFYGFNGYESIYIPNFEDDQSDEYISRVYYHHQRKFIRFTCDLQGNISGKSLKWFGGIGYFDFDINSVDVDKLNSGKAEEDKLPEEQLLYDKYVDIGIIGENEKDGGIVPSLKAGIVYDTRDNEPNPMTGTWSEAILFYSVPAFTNSTYSYLKIAITHRQYFTLKKNVLSLAYRVGYQGTLAGKVPFYMQPYMITSFAKVTTTDGLGGSKTLRGILRNRVVGDGIAYGNLEMRWKFFKTVLWNQNIYLAFNTFADAGRVLQSIHVPEEEWASIYPSEDIQAEKLHIAVGAGFRVALNQNFIVAFDYGKALDTRDGIDGFYAGIGYLF